MKSNATFLLALVATVGRLAAGEQALTDSAATVPSPAAATIYPIPNLTGPFLGRDRLLRDLGGYRQTLAEHGIELDFNMTNSFQGVLTGGDSEGGPTVSPTPSKTGSSSY